jgi:cytochrome c peroxidase
MMMPDLSQVPRSGGPVTDREAAAAWGALTDAQRDDVTRVFVKIGKAIAAYERRIEFGPSRFDTYVDVTAHQQ